MKKWAAEFYSSRRWRACKGLYIGERRQIDGGMCELCKVNPGYIVHHKIELTPDNISNPDVALNHDNLQFLCKQCHDEQPDHWLDSQGGRRRRATFDENGQPIDLRRVD